LLIWPAIDLMEGHCVRLRQGAFDQATEYDADPVEVAQSFADCGADGLHVVDLDGARAGAPMHFATLERLAQRVTLPIQFGGGIRTLEAIQAALDSGASRVILGTKLAQDGDFAKEAVHGFQDRIVAGIDSKGGRVAIAGWEESTNLGDLAFAQHLAALGYQRTIVTDIAKDGMMMGPNLEQLSRFVQHSGMKVLASGGVATLEDIAQLARSGVEGVIIGRALYDGAMELRQVRSLVDGQSN
jgi:phosphoribosylformimino-5-aminoimidazole carboxamide ribotide isomerase